jgi:DNA processing protein
MLNPVQIAALLLMPEVGRRAVQHLINTGLECTHLRPQELGDLLLEAGAQGPRIRIPTAGEMKKAYSSAERLLANAERLGMQVLTPDMQIFPKRLRDIPDPPVMLYVRGSVNCLLAETSVAVIGTREPSSYGAAIAEKLAARLAAKGIVVTSGLASGCDTAAHQGCLRAGGQTVAVMAHGLDRIYPAQNRELASGILDSDGCLISEYFPGVAPCPRSFIERDRLQSGLSAAVVVIETDIKGGTMHTVRFCLDQRRALGCIAHPPDLASHPKARGNQKLIADKSAFAIPDKEALEEFIGKFHARNAGVPTS